MEDLRDHNVVFLPDSTPILFEVVYDYDKWQSRSPQERDHLTRLLHDYQVGEDWEKEDSMQDISFSDKEIKSFSSHILVDGDDGLPQWYKPASRVAKTLNP